jgi:hypothetical protein
MKAFRRSLRTATPGQCFPVHCADWAIRRDRVARQLSQPCAARDDNRRRWQAAQGSNEMSRRPAVPAAAHAAASAVGALRSARGSLLLTRRPRTLRSANAPDAAVMLVAIDRNGAVASRRNEWLRSPWRALLMGRAHSWLAQLRHAQGVSS